MGTGHTIRTHRDGILLFSLSHFTALTNCGGTALSEMSQAQKYQYCYNCSSMVSRVAVSTERTWEEEGIKGPVWAGSVSRVLRPERRWLRDVNLLGELCLVMA